MIFNSLYPTRLRVFQYLSPTISTGLIFMLLAFTSCNEEVDGLIKESDINKWQYFTTAHGLPSDYINAIFEDSKGNFWIGTDMGISVFNGENFTNYNTNDGLLDNNVYAISEDKDGDIWVGTARGLNVLLDGQWLYFTYFYDVGVYSLLDMADDEGLLIGTGGYGIFRYSYTENSFLQFDFTDNCQGCNSVNSLFQASDESIWVGTFAGARKIKGTKITQYDAGDGLAGNIATTISEDSWGNIWIGTVEGKTISKISGNSISQVSFNNGANQNFIFGIQEDNDGKLWVGTVANGLFHYDGAIMKQIYQGPPDNTITTLRKDSRGNLWIGTSEGGVARYITNSV